MTYDACVIGAGADGLAAATQLARAGLRTVVVERNRQPGGRCQTREFHPGFRASPFADELAPIPSALFWSLGLARRGVIFLPAGSPSSLAARRLMSSTAALRDAVICRAQQDAEQPSSGRGIFRRRPEGPRSWPGEQWMDRSLAEELDRMRLAPGEAAQFTAAALCGRAADPLLAGSALHLLVPGAGGSGAAVGGLGTLATALSDCAREAGVELMLGVEASEVRRARGQALTVGLSNGKELAAAALISTLDLKRTLLSLFSWNDLPPAVLRRAGAFRARGSTARVLLALERPPERPAGTESLICPSRGALYAKLPLEAFEAAYASWRAGVIPSWPPAAVRLVSAIDPRLAPAGAATLTITLGCIPARPFDGAWTKEKRELLRDRAVTAADGMLPGTSARVLAADVIVPPDMEDALGATDGDLWGGEIMPDQMFGFRPWGDPGSAVSPRSPIAGLYLAGPSSAAGLFATCASGAIAAAAVIADRKAGRLR